MRSFDQSFSPVLGLQPQHTPQPFLNMATSQPRVTSPFVNRAHNSSLLAFNATPSTSAPSSAAGRKRSRDDAADTLGDDECFPPHDPPTPDNEDEWEYGEGMTLIKPNSSGYIIHAGSQTGTWAEEKADEQAKPRSPERPVLRSHKSQRLNLTATPAIAEELSLSNGTLVTPQSIVSVGATGPTEPTVDDFTRHLGIGWSSISSDEHIQAAARGWTKFIENHFPVTDVKIRLESRGLSSYLVEATEGYFLFGEDLKKGRLISTCLDRVWENLRGPVPVFDSEGIIEAGETPKSNGMMEGMTANTVDEVFMNGMADATAPEKAAPLGNEMDMS
ncbi:hypothetical protein B7494_g5438 [Chlorociboria aeruginascens]|nr:hypothetical protein B7494_g5438 [Chlorociboria aeruginascens]